MYLEKKIREIRNKPEHIRERYVWIAVGVCMLFIVSIWLLSLKTSLQQKKTDNGAVQIKELIDKSKGSIENMPSLPDIKNISEEVGTLAE